MYACERSQMRYIQWAFKKSFIFLQLTHGLTVALNDKDGQKVGECSKNVLLTFLKVKMCGYILYLMQFRSETGTLHLQDWF